MEFKHLSQPDFDRERDGAIEEILGREWWREAFPSMIDFAKQTYNEGYKQALKDWAAYFANGGHRAANIGFGTLLKEIKEEVDKIDKEA